MVNTRSLSVSAATLPKPTDVMHVMVKYNAVTYIVFRDGPFTSSGKLVSFDHTIEYGLCVTLANFQSQLYCTCSNIQNAKASMIESSSSSFSSHSQFGHLHIYHSHATSYLRRYQHRCGQSNTKCMPANVPPACRSTTAISALPHRILDIYPIS